MREKGEVGRKKGKGGDKGERVEKRGKDRRKGEMIDKGIGERKEEEGRVQCKLEKGVKWVEKE